MIASDHSRIEEIKEKGLFGGASALAEDLVSELPDLPEDLLCLLGLTLRAMKKT